MLAPATTFGKNLLPRVAALLDVAQISEITGVVSADTFVRPIYAGNAMATVQSADAVKVITVRTTAFDAPASGNNAPIESLSAGVDGAQVSLLERELTKSERPELGAAKIIVSGGRGLGSGENYHKLLEPLADKLGVLDYKPQDHGSDCTVVLHTSCSARREMGVHLSGRKLLGELSQVTIAQQDHESECCGFGGTFSIKQPEISGAMVEDKLKALKATGAERVVSADCGCLMNILGHAAWKDAQEGRAKPSLPGEHIASFLLRRTGGAQ